MSSRVEEQTDSSGYTVRMKEVKRPDIGLAIAATNFGQKIIQSPKAAESTGFPVLYQSNMNTPVEIRRDQSIAVAAQTITAAIALMGWSGREVQRLAVGSSVIWDRQYLPQIMEASGLSHLDWQTQVAITGLACNSGARALQKELMREKKQGPTVVATFDDLTGRIANEEEVDPLSRVIFSNGMAALALVPGQGLKYKVGSELFVHPDDGKALAARVDFPKTEAPNEHIGQVIRQENWEYMVIPRPENPDQWIRMKGGETARLFVRLVATYAPQFLDKLDLAVIDQWVSHLPSAGPFRAINARFPGLGLKWRNINGNASGSTLFMALAEQMEEFEPGQTTGFLGFGAGASLTMFTAQLGGK